MNTSTMVLLPTQCGKSTSKYADSIGEILFEQLPTIAHAMWKLTNAGLMIETDKNS